MGLSSVSFDEVADPYLHDAAYPAIHGGVAGFVGRYLAARETVLILQGRPGTGNARPGRCFEVMRTRPLSRAEVSGLLAAEGRELAALQSDSAQLTVLDGLFGSGARQVSVAAIYRAIDAVGSQDLSLGK